MRIGKLAMLSEVISLSIKINGLPSFSSLLLVLHCPLLGVVLGDGAAVDEEGATDAATTDASLCDLSLSL